MKPPAARRPFAGHPARTGIALAVAFAAAFFGVLYRILDESLANEQLVNSLILLGVIAAYLAYDFRPRFRPRPTWNREVAFWLALAAVPLAGAVLTGTPAARDVSFFLAFCVFLRASGEAVFRDETAPFLNALLLAFTVFGILVLVLPYADVPLRFVAGRFSAGILEFFGGETQLAVTQREGAGILLLFVNGRPFEVAPECNGFGLLGSSLILTGVLVAYRRIGGLDTLLLFLAAGVVAVIGNLVRIVVIVTLAPHVGDHYFLMHEIVGNVALYASLGLLFWLISGFGARPRHDPGKETPAPGDPGS